jgi:EAL domain-containing protein (putative c-di-GMP-specific phosphodiesterase class I)
MNQSPDNDARVLVVDNEAINVTVLTKLLGRAGIGIIEGVTNSSEVMGRVRDFEPDIVLLDLHMPAPDGFELLRQITAAAGDSYLPVVIITADITDEAKERALAAGAADFLTKPFRATEALLRVRNLIHTRRLHQALARHNIRLTTELAEVAAIDRDKAERIRRVTSVADRIDDHLTMVFQPIVDLATRETYGNEALARFSAVPLRPPDEWFADAVEAGIGVHLELAAVRRALDQADWLPPSTFVSVNVSPTTLRSPAFAELVTSAPSRPIVIELTEHDHIDDYVPIIDVITELRRQGLRLAVDDTGVGFASLHHILKLQPEFIKLDRLLVTDIDTDPAREALASALVKFSNDTGAQIIAEGIETAAELDTLADLGVHYGQGYHLGRPDHLAAPPPGGRGTTAPAHDGVAPDPLVGSTPSVL